MKRSGSAADPLWYKDAIIYELHVRSFADGNGDGVGDFSGLLQKLDYLQDLGITCLWLLPFFPSPLRDDGYDISDYTQVHPNYGTLEDFQAVLTAAHDRGLQVLIELVMNHTSDQHPWFQAARRAPAGSPERDYYVWSNTDQRYADVRIIFTDTEKSNWTWDPVAKAFFWHRFFSHQPDLNFDNPRVVEEMSRIVRFWLDLGVDALRIDAIPYLIEREGTNCENLPETHAQIRNLRRLIDEEYTGRMILAEANQWPTDVRPYFGDGDECHMAFHFPLMPRIYMALRQEDRLPITDIMAQTPEIPASCQWGLFLRNHDELTLEMVTSDERDYMYLAYSGDPRMRLNLGIRRRLAPLMDNNRRRIELLNSLLLSFPGTPIVYYGDEIGMGDNIYLGDRNGVRTPMQWSADRNAGFSRATPARLYSPVIMDALYGYEAVNVEAQQSDPSSLLHWFRNMIALRKLFRVFGRGTLEFLNPLNRKVLAYLRRFDGEQILCVANLSRFAQPVDLDLSEWEGMVPVEMLGYVEFPPIGRQPYRLTLGAYSFLWLELHGTAESAETANGNSETVLTIAGGWESLFEGAARSRFERTVLPAYFPKQRWFTGRSRRIRSTEVRDWTTLDPLSSALALIEVHFESGEPETYLLPLMNASREAANAIRATTPQAILAATVTSQGSGILHDGIYNDGVCASLFALLHQSGELRTQRGVIKGVPCSPIYAALEEGPQALRRDSTEQGTSSIVFGERAVMTLFRRYEPGPNPACEVGLHLTKKTQFDRVLSFAGSIDYVADGTEPANLAMLQGYIDNEGDGWTWTLEEVERYYENCAPLTYPGDAAEETKDPLSQFARDHVGLYLEAAATLGRRTAELHRALAVPEDNPVFSPEPFTSRQLQALLDERCDDAIRTFETLKGWVSRLPDELIELAGLALARRRQILDRLRAPASDGNYGLLMRVHGNYHLGQVLRTRTDYVIRGFEGDFTQPLARRRAKQSPLKDVAAMLRSFSYGAYVALINYTARRPEDFPQLEPWARLWERSASAAFLRAYRETGQGEAFLPGDATLFRGLLNVYWWDQALTELRYELTHRPAYVRVPLIGILSSPPDVI
jgi:maltose alpha-D-glucosyltransferase/alpha-amylase